MNVGKVGLVSFGDYSSQYANRPQDFYLLSYDKKLNVIYDMLRDLSKENHDYAKTITKNQEQIYKTNKASHLELGLNSNATSSIYDIYKSGKVNVVA